MKKIFVMFTMMMVAMVTFAKDIKTVVFTTTPHLTLTFSDATFVTC